MQRVDLTVGSYKKLRRLGGNSSKEKKALRRFWRPVPVIAFLLMLVFAVGGGARGDIVSLMLLRPVAAILLGLGLSGIRTTELVKHRFLFGMTLAIVALVAAQLVPLPPAIWHALPGRDIVQQIDQVANLGPVWRPISLAPLASWNALFALLPPAATMVWGARLVPSQQSAVVLVIVGLGFASAVLAVLQLSGSYDAFYLYRVTNLGSGVGLFANRNHQALFLTLMFPLLAVLAFKDLDSDEQGRLWMVVSLVGMLVPLPLLLVTGSRAGLVVGVLGLTSVPVLGWSAMSRGQRSARIAPDIPRWIVTVFAALLIIGVVAALIFGRSEALDRFTQSSALEDFRIQAWGTVAQIAWNYFPAGSGFGSFVQVFQVSEPYSLLSLQYFNHAHNDWLELVMTGGAAAVVLLGIAVAAFLWTAFRWVRRPAGPQKLLGGAGLYIILMFAVASITDYPLRVPSLACLFVLAAIWAGTSDSAGQANTLR